MSFRWRLFSTYVIVIVVSLLVVALGVALLMRSYVDRLSLESLNDMARPIIVQIGALVRGNVTPQQLLFSLQEQSDRNNAYILLVDSSGDIVRQLNPQLPDSLPPVEVAPGALPKTIAPSVQGRFTASDGRVFLYTAYPLARQGDQLSRVDTLVLARVRPRAFVLLMAFIWPILIAGGIALIISLPLAVLLARSVYRPLDAVTKAARLIATGDYTQRVNPKGPKEIKALAESFNLMTQNVEWAQLRLRHFVADVSHELKSPLTSIQGFAQALLDGTAADEATKLKATRIINDESKRLRRQVDELLELSRMQSNQVNVLKEPVDVRDVLQHCVEVFSIQAKEKLVNLELKSEPDVIVTGDYDRLEQVFSNLIDNAIKNSPAGGKVSIDCNNSGGQLVQIVVSDEGPGIPDDQLSHVFERFYQVTGTRTGVGLGLAIAKEIVSAHGGKIEASSTPGEGSRFTVSLPPRATVTT